MQATPPQTAPASLDHLGSSNRLRQRSLARPRRSELIRELPSRRPRSGMEQIQPTQGDAMFGARATSRSQRASNCRNWAVVVAAVTGMAGVGTATTLATSAVAAQFELTIDGRH